MKDKQTNQKTSNQPTKQTFEKQQTDRKTKKKIKSTNKPTKNEANEQSEKQATNKLMKNMTNPPFHFNGTIDSAHLIKANFAFHPTCFDSI